MGHVALGVGKCVAKGLDGLASKSTAAVMDIPGYGLKGLKEEVERQIAGSDSFTKDSLNAITELKAGLANQGMNHNSLHRHTSDILWHEAKGACSGKQILQ